MAHARMLDCRGRQRTVVEIRRNQLGAATLRGGTAGVIAATKQALRKRSSRAKPVHSASYPPSDHAPVAPLFIFGSILHQSTAVRTTASTTWRNRSSMAPPSSRW